MAHSDQGIVKDMRAEDQPRDKERAQSVHTTDKKGSPSREATRDPKLSDNSKTPGSGAMPDGSSDATG
ncbi:hypothetical protein [Bradyrhizobium sp. CCH5-F6]|jgi:hypothetical protein|uniref:hypothetical protein n=1 Tax=Bradyrhizobium sp. CCH5-F6 TaxID=1768753 RepID=UPI00076A736F|nr:hypothetical protein [Bradyrhizobium sp. CCH5-F6]